MRCLCVHCSGFHYNVESVAENTSACSAKGYHTLYLDIIMYDYVWLCCIMFMLLLVIINVCLALYFCCVLDMEQLPVRVYCHE